MENAKKRFSLDNVKKYLAFIVQEGIKNEQAIAYIGLAFAVLCWAANTVLARGVVNETGPMALSFWRWVTAWLIIIPFSLTHVRRERKTIGENKLKLALLALFSVAIYNSVLYVAAQFTTAVNMLIVTAAFPAITVVVAWVLIKETPEKIQIAGIFISALGMLAIIFKGSPTNVLSLQFNFGDLLVVGSVLSWSVYSVFLRKFEIALHPLTLLTMTISLGIVMILPFYLLEAIHTDLLRLTSRSVYIFLFLAVFPSLLAYLFWNHGVLKVGPVRSALFLYLLPVFGSLLAYVFLGEKIKLYHLMGSILIFTGLYLAIKRST